jgi:hypothetical protein
LPPAVIRSGPRFALRVSTFAGELGEVGGRGLEQRLPRRWDRPALEEILRLLLGDSVAEAVAELLLGQRDRTRAVRRVAQRRRRDPERAEGGRKRTPLIGAGSIATAAAARSSPSRRYAISPPKE